MAVCPRQKTFGKEHVMGMSEEFGTRDATMFVNSKAGGIIPGFST